MHVWRVLLDEDSTASSTLSATERIRAERFRSVVDANRFANGRRALRSLLGAYSGLSEQQVEIVEGQGRKPNAANVPALRFNVTHSGALCLIALTRSADVGIDVELERNIPEMYALASRHFTPLEQDEILCGKGTFLTCWTRKEAVLKLRGTGLHHDLSRMHVGAAPRIARCDGAVVKSFIPAEAAIAAVAYEECITAMRYLVLPKSAGRGGV
jgi:4'-phosphopantetheinyl transferase